MTCPLPMHHRSLDVLIDQDIDFSTLVQNKHLLSGLEHSGYASPSPIQLQAIPLGRLGVDLVAQAKSGTGKTVVFGVISLEAIQVVERVPQALIVAPTREIAIQIRDVVRNLGKSMEGLQCEAVIGGLSTQGDEQKVKYSQIVVGTPGRLMALLDAKRINTHSIKLLVLDEADKLMSDTFRPQINYIFRKLPVTKQCVAFSATFTEELLSALGTMMNSPQIVRLTETVPTLQEVQQYYQKVNRSTHSPENEAMAALQVYEAKFEAAADVLGKIPFYQCMIFVNSVPRAIELSKWLTDMGWRSGHISSSLSQDQRLSVMENMRDFKLRILVCSDLIARGIDIDRVNLVINIDFPWEIETYLHRVGRTGRFGTSGVALNLVGPKDEQFMQRLKDYGIIVEPLPEVVVYSEYRKELTEKEQETLSHHQGQRAKKESQPLVYQKVIQRKHKVSKAHPPAKRVEAISHPIQKTPKQASLQKRKAPTGPVQPATKKQDTKPPPVYYRNTASPSTISAPFCPPFFMPFTARPYLPPAPLFFPHSMKSSNANTPASPHS